jgi:Mg2+ and Co2+ transporter CorA
MAHDSEHPIAELVEAAALQAEVTHQRLALEWGHMMLTHVVQLWDQLEALEDVAYEDKVAAQLRMLDETTGSLWRLHKTLAHTRRVLQQHLRRLRREGTSLDLISTPAGRLPEASAKTCSLRGGAPSRRGVPQTPLG